MHRAAERIEPYAAKRRKPGAQPAWVTRHVPNLHRLSEKHLPNAKKLTRKGVKAGRRLLADQARDASGDATILADIAHEGFDNLLTYAKRYDGPLNMNEGLNALVSKMNPDPADLHAVGSSGKKKKLRKVPPATGGM